MIKNAEVENNTKRMNEAYSRVCHYRQSFYVTENWDNVRRKLPSFF